MITERYEGTTRARVLIGMVTRRFVLARIAAIWKSEGLFDTRWANLVGGWCISYLQNYNDAPSRNIQSIFENWIRETTVDEDTIGRVELFLKTLSDFEGRDDDQTDEYLIDLAGKFFNEVNLQNELQAIQNSADRKDWAEVEERMTKHRRLELGVGSYIEPISSLIYWEEAFNEMRRKPLVNYNGALGRYLSEAFLRGEFYAFLAPEKTGKTAYLIDFTYRAMRSKNKVAYFECGDGDQNEVLCRLGCRASKLPEFGGEYEIPTGWNEDQVLQTEMVKFEKATEIDAFQETLRSCRSETNFRLVCEANSVMTTQDIDGCLTEWALSDWRPDVVVIDYADILAPPRGVKDKIEQIDAIWRHLRRISQQHHCLVMTATQANAKSYGKSGFLGPENFSGSKTKNAHVNGILGINVSAEERQMNSGRLKWAVRRKSKTRGSGSFVSVAGCFGIDSPIIVSR